MKFDKVLTGRRSIRRWSDTPITHEEIKKVLKAAQLAPSWKNSQSARFYVVTQDSLLEQLKENGLPPFNQNNSDKAPCLIVACFEVNKSGLGADGKYANECEEGWSYFDLGLAVENMCLEAYNLGLGTLIMGIRNAEAIRTMLHIPENQKICAVIALGTPNIDPPKPKRLKLKETAVFFE